MDAEKKYWILHLKRRKTRGKRIDLKLSLFLFVHQLRGGEKEPSRSFLRGVNISPEAEVDTRLTVPFFFFFLVSNGDGSEVLVRPREKLGHRRQGGPGRTASVESDPAQQKRTTWKLPGPPDAPKPTRPSPLPSPPRSLLFFFISSLLVSPSYQPGIYTYIFFCLQTGVDFTATTKTDHAMTERALGTSTESITGNKSNGEMLRHSFRRK